MDSIVEENGTSSSNLDEGHNLTTTARDTMQPPPQQQQHTQPNNSNSTISSASQSTNAALLPPPSVLTTTSNVVQYLPPAATHGLPMRSVIQAANQSSVIQTATAGNTQPIAMQKGSVLYVSKPNTTVIHTTSGNAVQIPPNFPCKIKPEPNTQHPDTNSEDSLSDDDTPHRRSDLTRRPSYHKIFTEISGPDISDNSGLAEDQTRKREIRLQKNREAARECRRKKKEYIKCLENRVAVLENQNKALIDELKSLKELYCQTKND